ncbi:hypothetical protein ACGFIK_24055 [Micromonospora sp. NPDC048871]|uniref:hypothetical protein n=1 Tax=unclassified Micromonospora TaxID=2617518 RepID=UPI002E0DF39C|nr:hypothetical protein OIE53_07070 [Micromonospora sp. NBC_01739]
MSLPSRSTSYQFAPSSSVQPTEIWSAIGRLVTDGVPGTTGLATIPAGASGALPLVATPDGSVNQNWAALLRATGRAYGLDAVVACGPWQAMTLHLHRQADADAATGIHQQALLR